MLLAQAVGEYTSLSAILTSLEEAWLTAKTQLSGIDSQTWLVVGIAAFVLFFLWNRR